MPPACSTISKAATGPLCDLFGRCPIAIILESSCRCPGEDVGLTVEGRDQTVNAVCSQDGELGTAGRDFAYRAVR
jgi:hypothetical protein